MFQHANLSRRRFLGTAAMTIAAAQFGTIVSAKTSSRLSSLARATTWLNSQPLTDADLRGKVVLVEFWTYTCINWRRQLPYVRVWAEKYKDHGLVVVGVHSPEFTFERNIDNVRWAAKDMRVDYPITVDNDHAIWSGFSNEYWPALYFIDAKGHIRHHVFGEGQYDESELVIQRLLSESGNSGVPNQLASVDARGAEAAADWRELQSGENYVGYERTQNFGSPGGIKADRPHVYAVARQLRRNEWDLSGNWTMGREAVVLNVSNGRIAYRFHARDLHLVMGPAAPSSPVRFRVFIDGQAPQAAHGVDVDDQGNGILTKPSMYQLIRQSSPVTDRQFEIQFFNSGVEAFSFTFG